MKIVKTRDVKTPERGTSKSAGIDFFVPNVAGSIKIQPGKSVLIPSGIVAKIPEGFGLFVENKSSVAVNKGLVVGACVVDEDYQGEIKIHLLNVSDSPVTIEAGEKIVQMVLLPVNYEGIEIVETLKELHPEQTERGTGGFGSTNKVERDNEVNLQHIKKISDRSKSRIAIESLIEIAKECNLRGMQEKEDIRAYNVGSSNYAKHKIQPWDIWKEYDLNPWDADIVKRTLRDSGRADRRLDYEKIIHICKERIRQIDSEQ